MTEWISPQWSQERVEALRRYYAEGLSAAQIARQLGGFTRNAVIGKLHRLGLRRGYSGAHRARNPGASASLRPKREKPSARINPQARERAMKPAPVPASKPVLLSGMEKPWTERKFDECAFPSAGEGADTLSCCAPTAGRTYCPFHRTVMFTSEPPEPRRKRVRREPTFYDLEREAA